MKGSGCEECNDFWWSEKGGPIDAYVNLMNRPLRIARDVLSLYAESNCDAAEIE
jgi:hypothetical protein